MKRRQFLMSSAIALGGVGLGGTYWTRRWNYIVIHHSAGDYGDIDFLSRVHRERQAGDPIDAIPYHYVIGNGNGLAMGEVASDWRQGYDIWGAHVSGRNTDWNFRGIGVCLIGNFENHEVPPTQYSALLSLTQQLMRDYAIPAEHVNGHGYITGEATKCPGKHFPMQRFLHDIRRNA